MFKLKQAAFLRKSIKIFRDIILFKYKRDVQYRIGEFIVSLPYGHKLPEFQQGNPKYDRFLPHLAHFLPDNSFIIDVGANCADTFAGMYDGNSALNFICVEADRFFFKYLKKNVKSILSVSRYNSDVRLVNEFTGDSLDCVVMEGRDGTKHAVSVDMHEKAAIKSVPLDEILVSQSVKSSDISLLKVDTDGFDYDVINSASFLTKNASPLIFFECQYESLDQLSSYKKLLSTLSGHGYVYFAIFDNFGSLMLSVTDLHKVHSLMDYIWSQNTGNATRTVYYLDILAAKAPSLDMLQPCLLEYIKQ